MGQTDLMTINTLRLSNFASYLEGEIDLSDRITIILGKENGSGKTTIAEAICRLLTGKYISKVSDSDKVRHGASGYMLECEGEFCNVPLSISLSHKSKRSTLLINYGNETFRDSDAVNFLSSIVTYDEFKTLVYLHGSTIDEFITKTPQTRSKIIDKMIGIENITTVIDALKTSPIRSEISDIRDKISKKQAEREILLNIIDKSKIREELEAKLSEETERLRQLESILSDLRNEESELREKIVKVRKIIQKRRKLIGQIDHIADLISRNEARRDQLKEELKRINENLTSYSNGKNAVEVLREITKEIEKITEKISDTFIDDAVTEIRSEIIEKKNDVCPVCLSPLSEETIMHIKKMADENDSIKSYRERLITLRKKKSDILSVIREKKLIMGDIKRYTSEISKLKEKKTLLESELEKYTYDENIESQLRDIIQKREKTEFAKAEVERHINGMREQLSRMRPEEEITAAIEEIEEELSMLNERLSLYTYKLDKVTLYKNGLKTILSDMRAKTLEMLNPKIEEWMEIFVQSTEQNIMPLSVRLNAVEKVTQKMHSVFYEIIPSRYGFPISYESLSSGERALCAVAIILAIEDISFHKLDFIILDEIHTSGMDDRALKIILDVLSAISDKIKIIFIERREEVVNALVESARRRNVPYTLYDVKSVDGISVATKRQ